MNEPAPVLQLDLNLMKPGAPGARMRPAASRSTSAVIIEIRVESLLWNARRNARAVLRRAVRRAAAAACLSQGEVCVVLCDDEAMRVLNRDWRQKDMPTNVLAFPVDAGNAAPGRPRLLGDIVIAYQTLQREAHVQAKPFAQHLAHLAVHGFLHLLGYDHRIAQEAQVMERLETSILARLDIPNPYGTGRIRGSPIRHA
jgi:probable rRNA maturation factor